MKIKNKFRFLTGVALAVALFSLARDTYAQKQKEPVANIVATVNIYNAKIDSQDGNRLKISFDIYNKTGVQPGVEYDIELVRVEKTGKSLYDKNVYSETLELGPNQTMNKTVEYEAPAFASGNFEVWVISQNDKGVPLGVNKAGEITLSGGKKFIDISGCYLKIEGDQKETKYALNQGVDISKEENIIAVCQLKNNFENAVTATPSFASFKRTVFGQLLSEKKESSVTLESGESKQVEINIPKESNPQAYDVVLSLLDGQDKKISNSINFHYVIQGFSSTIQNVRLDKSDYLKGDNAKIFFSWSGPADIFRGSRGQGTKISEVVAEIVVINSSGQDCISPFQKKLSQDSVFNDIDIPVTSDCPNAQISAMLKDTNGNILDRFASKNKTIQKNLAENQPQEKGSYANIFLALTLILILLIILIYVFRKRKKSATIVSLFFAIILSVLLFSPQAQADTWATNDAFGTWYWNANLNKTSYNPGEQIYAYSTGAVAYNCMNRHYMEIWGTINGANKMVYGGITNEIYFTNVTQGNVFTASNVSGSYLADFEYRMSWYPLRPHGYISYDVVCTPTNWNPDPNTVSCGTAFTQNSNCPGITRPATGTKSCCYCNSAENLSYCKGEQYTNSCGMICNGAKACSSAGWKEVSP